MLCLYECPEKASPRGQKEGWCLPRVAEGLEISYKCAGGVCLGDEIFHHWIVVVVAHTLVNLLKL